VRQYPCRRSYHRFEVLEPIRQGVREYFGFAKGAGRGLPCGTIMDVGNYRQAY
jgi:hypothetical protein